MNHPHGESLRSLKHLARFLFWYGSAVFALFYLLPEAGSVVDGWYDQVSRSVRFLAILGFFAVVAVWHGLDRLRRWRAALPGRHARREAIPRS